MLLEDRVRRLEETHLVLRLHLGIVLRIAVNRLPGHVGARRFDRIFDHHPHALGQTVELGLVEHHLELLGVLVIGLQHANLGDVREAQCTVGRRIVEFRRIQQAAIHRRNDLAARQRIHGCAHLLEHVDRNADGAIFQAFQIVELGDRILEPAQRLARHRAVDEGLHIGANGGVELGQKFLAAAVLVPGQQHIGVHREARAGAPKRQRILLPVMIGEHAMARVQRAGRDSVEQTESRNDRAGGQHVDAEVAARHVIDLLGDVLGEFVENIL